MFEIEKVREEVKKQESIFNTPEFEKAKEDIAKQFLENKEKVIWLLDILKILDDMYIYLPDITEEDGLDLSYKDIDNIVEFLKN